MSLFVDPTSEDKLCQVLKAYVSEFTAEAVSVTVPLDWTQYSTKGLGPVRLVFENTDSVTISSEAGAYFKALLKKVDSV